MNTSSGTRSEDPAHSKTDANIEGDTGDVLGVSSFNGSLKRFSYREGGRSNQDSNSGQGAEEGKQVVTKSIHNRKDRRRPVPEVRAGEPSKRQRTRAKSSSVAAPSRYAHLPLLNDVLAPNLLILFIGLNPGITTSQTGHAYAHPSNLFWKLLYSSGITDRRCSPEEDVDMPRLFNLGFTNIVGRPTKDQSELSRAEMVDGAPVLEAKANKWHPEVCCLVGKGIWEAVYKKKHGHQLVKNNFHYGWQDESENIGKDRDWHGSRVFVAASTSGLSASLKPHEKEAIWKPLGQWARERRAQRLQALQ